MYQLTFILYSKEKVGVEEADEDRAVEEGEDRAEVGGEDRAEVGGDERVEKKGEKGGESEDLLACESLSVENLVIWRTNEKRMRQSLTTQVPTSIILNEQFSTFDLPHEIDVWPPPETRDTSSKERVDADMECAVEEEAVHPESANALGSSSTGNLGCTTAVTAVTAVTAYAHTPKRHMRVDGKPLVHDHGRKTGVIEPTMVRVSHSKQLEFRLHFLSAGTLLYESLSIGPSIWRFFFEPQKQHKNIGKVEIWIHD